MRRLIRWLQFNWMYLGRPPWDTGVSPPELLDFISEQPPGRAIDLGCGTGTNLLTLGKAGWSVTGVDFALKAVTAARRKLASAGIKGDVRSGDVSRLDVVQGSYDLALDLGCYHGLDRPAKDAYRRNLSVILNRDAHFLLYAHFWPPGVEAGHGIAEADIDAFSAQFRLLTRQDGEDRIGRSSVWLLYQNHPAV